MKINKILVLFAIGIFALAAPASLTNTKAGGITIKIDAQHAQVSMGDQVLRVGDKVLVYKEKCQGPRVPLCKKEALGTATVSKVLNDKAAEIKTDGHTILDEGLHVEKEIK